MKRRTPKLSVKQISKHFGGLKAVDGVSFDLFQGEILGLLGPNGAGKTTCFNMISGVYKPTNGEIWLEKQRTDRFAPHQMANLGVGRTFQVVKPFAELTVQENIIVALGLTRYGRIFSSVNKWLTSDAREKSEEILKQVGLSDYAQKKAGELPLGNLRRMEIGRALALNPKVLLLDESFSGLRHEEIHHMEELVLALIERGISVLLIEHNMKVAMKLCDRVVVLDHGKKLVEGTPQEISQNPAVIEAYLGKGGLQGLASS